MIGQYQIGWSMRFYGVKFATKDNLISDPMRLEQMSMMNRGEQT